MTITKIYTHDIPEWDAIEIHPIKDGEQMEYNEKQIITKISGDDTTEIHDEGTKAEPDYWCVFLHHTKGGIDEFADVPTRDDAMKLKELLQQLIKHHTPRLPKSFLTTK